jgi:deoxyribodipyrimidine photo-lyase
MKPACEDFEHHPSPQLQPHRVRFLTPTGVKLRAFPAERIRYSNNRAANLSGTFVLYWMTAFRRLGSNFALDRAVAWAEATGKPLLILESFSLGFPWSSERHFWFVLQGMQEKAKKLQTGPALYLPVLEQSPGDIAKLLSREVGQLVCVITDDYPLRPWQRQIRQIGESLPICVEAVDSCGLVPLAASSRIFTRAVDFRCFWQKNFRKFLSAQPELDSLPRLPPLQPSTSSFIELLRQVAIDPEKWLTHSEKLHALPWGRKVFPVELPGGTNPARKRLAQFVLNKLEDYDRRRNHPDLEGTSGLSPYLKWGFISTQEIFWEVARAENWSLDRCLQNPLGKKNFFGMGAGAEEFLDQLFTWREIGFNFAAFSDRYDQFESLPDWATQTLKEHACDKRSYMYTLSDLEHAATHDPVWNAAQTELMAAGTIHNYLRMLWGKKILEWTSSPEEALAFMIELNNKFALDAEDPNSYSGIFWILGRYDRPWGPERPIFGKVRYMSTEAAVRKLKMESYLDRFSPQRVKDRHPMADP